MSLIHHYLDCGRWSYGWADVSGEFHWSGDCVGFVDSESHWDIKQRVIFV